MVLFGEGLTIVLLVLLSIRTNLFSHKIQTQSTLKKEDNHIKSLEANIILCPSDTCLWLHEGKTEMKSKALKAGGVWLRRQSKQ